jgi:hypothetical protein
MWRYFGVACLGYIIGYVSGALRVGLPVYQAFFG